MIDDTQHNKDCELGDNWKDCPACLLSHWHIRDRIRCGTEYAEESETTDCEYARYQKRICHNAIEWFTLSDAGLRLRCGMLTASEIRLLRAVLKAIVKDK